MPLTIIVSVIVIAYTWAGGMWAVIYTDLFQFILLTVGITIAALIIFNKVGGMSSFIAYLEPTHLSITGGWPLRKLVPFFLTFLFAEAMAPFYVQRYLSTKSPRDSRWGVTIFGVYYGFFTILIVVIGLSGAILLPNIAPDLVMGSLVRDFLPAGLVGLVFAAMMAAMMATTDSILNTSAVIFTRDIYQKFINPAASDTIMLKWSKVTTIVIGIGGLIVALSVPRVFDLLIYTYSFWAPSMLPPLCLALLWGKALERKVSPYAGPPAIVAGLIFTFKWGSRTWFMLPAVAAGIAANLGVFLIVQILTFKKKPVDGIFAPVEIKPEA
jgi:SSS family solute:Na+ symporter